MSIIIHLSQYKTQETEMIVLFLRLSLCMILRGVVNCCFPATVHGVDIERDVVSVASRAYADIHCLLLSVKHQKTGQALT
jgi:hypothetical protein